jgi:hypothetical protein
VFSRINGELQEVQQALQSSRAVSTAPLTIGTGNEPTQLHQITEKVKSHLRRAQEDIAQATQALTQVHNALVEQQSKEELEKLSLQAKWDEEKSQL